jgi:hypothetical protein
MSTRGKSGKEKAQIKNNNKPNSRKAVAKAVGALVSITLRKGVSTFSTCTASSVGQISFLYVTVVFNGPSIWDV